MTTIPTCKVFTPQFHHYYFFNQNHLSLKQCQLLSCHRSHYNHSFFSCNSKVKNPATSTQYQGFHNIFDDRDFPHESSYVDELIKELIIDGLYEDAVKLYVRMLDDGFVPNVFQSFPILVKAIGGLGDFELSRQVHGHLLKLGVTKFISVANSLLSALWKCGASDDAVLMFETMQKKDSISWSTMISSLHQSGLYIMAMEWFARMVCEFNLYLNPNRVACISALSSCASGKSVLHGREVHAFLVKSGLDDDEFVLSGLLDFYMKCGLSLCSKKLFDSMGGNVRENSVLWNVMILGYVENRCYSEALNSFIQMIGSGVVPDTSTMVAVVVLCSESLNIPIGQQIHALIVKFGLERDVRVQTTLIDMYFNCLAPDSGLKLFETSSNHNIIMWGTVITNCVRGGYASKALELFITGLGHGYLNSILLLTALRACSSLALSHEGMLIHNMAVKLGLDLDTYIGSALIDMYMKCQDMSSAKNVFLRLPVKDEVSWSNMISGYTHNEQWDDAVGAFCQMHKHKIKPNAVMISCLLSICARIFSNLQCKEIHSYIIRGGLETNILVNNSLVVSYAKCGNLKSSWRVFSRLEIRDEVSWNSMMLGLGLHGHVDDMLFLFDVMKNLGLKPDHQTFTAILSGCSHTGRVDDGLKCFRSMSEQYKLEPKLEQYTCLVDLLGRAGYLDQAYDLIINMPHTPDDRIWGSLLGSCRIHGNERLAEVVADHIFKLCPDSVGYRVLLANLYEDSSNWNESMLLRSHIKEIGLKKSPGCSWIDINKQIHVFTASDRTHHEVENVYAMLKCLTTQMVWEGYIPQL